MNVNSTPPSSHVLPARLSDYFKDYSTHHQTPGNKLCHYVGVPMIVISTLGLLATLVIGNGFTGSSLIRLDGGLIVLLGALCWYTILDWKLAMPFGLFAVGMYFLGRAMPVEMLWAAFILGWIIQGIGHYKYEKKSPSFFTNLRHLLIGPIWLFSKMIGYTR